VPEITPQTLADPAQREALEQRAANTANWSPVPGTPLPVKSQAADDPAIAELVAADQAVIDPARAQTAVQADSENTDKEPEGDKRTSRKGSGSS
jgi:hypothetical protein